MPVRFDTKIAVLLRADRAAVAAVAAVGRERLDLVGIAVHGARNSVDKVLKGARMHG